MPLIFAQVKAGYVIQILHEGNWEQVWPRNGSCASDTGPQDVLDSDWILASWHKQAAMFLFSFGCVFRAVREN